MDGAYSGRCLPISLSFLPRTGWEQVLGLTVIQCLEKLFLVSRKPIFWHVLLHCFCTNDKD